ncbi:MAG: hypothetical protein DRJ10_02540 [Bacteroidetes bacterium]|nr:MAG: hypothetical protein DRJ10_02540 [Bacteroidota bacterium]
MEENLREVFSAEKMYKIEIIQGFLNENNIESFVLNQRGSEFPVGETRLFVDEKDEAKAKEIVAAHEM